MNAVSFVYSESLTDIDKLADGLLVLQHLRTIGVVGKFVEFFGPGVAQLSIADRATIANMCPEYGATVGYFPVDGASLEYLSQTGLLRHENLCINVHVCTCTCTYMLASEYKTKHCVHAEDCTFYAFAGRDPEQIKVIEEYLKATRMFRDFLDAEQDPVFSQVGSKVAVMCV